MKPITAAFAAMLLLGTGVALAQTTATQSPAGANQPYSQQQNPGSTTMQSPATQPSAPQSQGTMSGQSSMGSQSQTSAGQQSIVGCVMKSGSDFYIVPEKGMPVKLQSIQPFTGKQNHLVGVTGQKEGGQLRVTQVTEIAASCPGRGSSTSGTGATGATTPGATTPGSTTPGSTTPGAGTSGTGAGQGTGTSPR